MKIWDKDDKHVFYLALSVGSGTVLLTWLNMRQWPEALALGGVAACTVSTIAYGGRVFGSTFEEGALAFNASVASALSGRMANGQAVDQTPRHGLPRFKPVRPVTNDETQMDRWRKQLRRFLTAGHLIGSYSLRQLAEDVELPDGRMRAKFLTDYGYRRMMKVFTDERWASYAPVMIADNTGTRFGPGWDYGRACYAVRREPLPIPLDEDPPEVHLGAW